MLVVLSLVTFTYKDRATGRKQAMTLSAEEFLRRFLLHVVPKRFVRIRYYGGLANATRRRYLEEARKLLAASGVPVVVPTSPPPRTWHERILHLTGIDPLLCPKCKIGRLIFVEPISGLTTPGLPPTRAGPS